MASHVVNSALDVAIIGVFFLWVILVVVKWARNRFDLQQNFHSAANEQHTDGAGDWDQQLPTSLPPPPPQPRRRRGRPRKSVRSPSSTTKRTASRAPSNGGDERPTVGEETDRHWTKKSLSHHLPRGITPRVVVIHLVAYIVIAVAIGASNIFEAHPTAWHFRVVVYGQLDITFTEFVAAFLWAFVLRATMVTQDV